jgi:hypothetical protein
LSAATISNNRVKPRCRKVLIVYKKFECSAALMARSLDAIERIADDSNGFSDALE